MNKILFTCLLLCSLQAQSKEELIVINSLKSFKVKIPEGWELKVKPSPPSVPSKVISLHKEDTKIAITFFSTKDGSSINRRMKALKDYLETVCQGYVSGSVEGEVIHKKVEKAHIKGYYASFTEKGMEGKKAPKGEYAFLTTGCFLARGVMITPTIMTGDAKGETYQQAMELILSLGKK